MKKIQQSSTFLASLVLIICWSAVIVRGGLVYNYYQATCPRAEAIIASLMQDIIAKDVNSSASIVRLHFHDCFVRGCDASVLINSTSSNQAEKDSSMNNSLQGFEIIDQLKAALEKECPGVVSCADTLAFAARESVFHAGITNRYNVRGGRRDGRISLASEANVNLPPSTGDVATLIKMFASKGLSATEMVTLSGAHSIGVAHCPSLANRQFSTFDPTSPLYLDPNYAQQLRQICPQNLTTNPEFFMDTFTPTVLDNKYYVALLQNKALFPSDATLLTNANTKSRVVAYANNPQLWEQQFVAAFVKMGEVQVLTGNRGEVRKICSVVN